MSESTVDAVTGKEVQFPERSMRNSKQKPEDDDDCVSEDSFGSDFDTAPEEENLKVNGANTELNSPPPPVYSEEEHLQSMSLLANMDVKSPPTVLQYTPPTITELEPPQPFSATPDLSGSSMCVVCKVSPTYSIDGVSYPTCRALQCAFKMQEASSTSPSSRVKMCDVCHLRPRAHKAGKIEPTCGLTCAAALMKTGPRLEGNAPTLESDQMLSPSFHSLSTWQPEPYNHKHFRGSTSTQTRTSSTCVVCLVNPCRDGRFVTCGVICTMRLCKQGSSNSKMCDYCHRRPKFPGHNQCGKTCRDNSNTACLVCRSRPRIGRYHLCGRMCKTIVSKWTPLILEVRRGHFTYNKVEQKFKHAWKGGGFPSIKKVYKIFENKSFLSPFDRYRRRVGNEVFRYHGTSRRCTLGSRGNTRPCPSTTCALCSILRTSFRISQSGPFGDGVYTSSSANQAYKFCKGAIILTKVVMGTVYNAKARHEVRSCPPGHNSVVFNPQNEETTVVYTNDAIRPVFLLIF